MLKLVLAFIFWFPPGMLMFGLFTTRFLGSPAVGFVVFPVIAVGVVVELHQDAGRRANEVRIRELRDEYIPGYEHRGWEDEIVDLDA
jgi:hypothetical protein